MPNKVITRFPPSPTGLFHIGSARTALFNYLFAKNQGGKMILRFEDTDKERSKEEYEKDILDGLEWLGIEYEGEVQRQSERTEIYKKYLGRLIDDDKAYISEEEKGDTRLAEANPRRRDEVIRFKNPGGEITFNDLVRGQVKFDVEELGDFVIAKSLDEPLYHLAVVVDDHEMEISHVIRGEDHISNTPRQILILEALGFERPNYAHIPLILAPDKSKLSKRHGTVSINEYKKMGYLPEALVNYLALLGWNPGDEREVFSTEDLVKEFSLEKVQKSGAIFNVEKLSWMNKEYIKKLSDEEFREKVGVEIPEKLLPLIKERVSKFSEVSELLEGELRFYFEEPEVSSNELQWKKDGQGTAKKYLKEILSLVEGLEEFNIEGVKEKIQPLADKEGRGSVLHPMRIALSGQERSPDPFTIAAIMGKEKTVKRLNKAIKKLS